MGRQDVKEWLQAFLTELHCRYLKTRGYRKKGRTFSRDMGDYWERFNFQGSANNYTGAEKWRFYINVGVEFKDKVPRIYWSLFPHTHWANRIEEVVPDTPQQWEYDGNMDVEMFSDRLAQLIETASQCIALKIGDIRGLPKQAHDTPFSYISQGTEES